MAFINKISGIALSCLISIVSGNHKALPQSLPEISEKNETSETEILKKSVYSSTDDLAETGTKRVIMLGTKWCGQGNKADSYNDLGNLDQLDRCCRAHDNCPLKIHKDMQRWGVRNTAGYTVMDCECDDAFHCCLRNKITSWKQKSAAWFVGRLFFNGLKTPCVQISKDADLDEPEIAFDPSRPTTTKKTAKLRKAKSYKKSRVPKFSY